MNGKLSLGNPNKERVGKYKDNKTGEIINIEENGLGTYRKVYENGRIRLLGTVVSDSDIEGLERIV